MEMENCVTSEVEPVELKSTVRKGPMTRSKEKVLRQKFNLAVEELMEMIRPDIMDQPIRMPAAEQLSVPEEDSLKEPPNQGIQSFLAGQWFQNTKLAETSPPGEISTGDTSQVPDKGLLEHEEHEEDFEANIKKKQENTFGITPIAHEDMKDRRSDIKATTGVIPMRHQKNGPFMRETKVFLESFGVGKEMEATHVRRRCQRSFANSISISRSSIEQNIREACSM